MIQDIKQIRPFLNFVEIEKYYPKCSFLEAYLGDIDYLGNGMEIEYLDYLINTKNIPKIDISFFLSKEFMENQDIFDTIKLDKSMSIFILLDIKNMLEWCYKNEEIENHENKENMSGTILKLEAMIFEENVKIAEYFLKGEKANIENYLPKYDEAEDVSELEKQGFKNLLKLSLFFDQDLPNDFVFQDFLKHVNLFCSYILLDECKAKNTNRDYLNRLVNFLDWLCKNSNTEDFKNKLFIARIIINKFKEKNKVKIPKYIPLSLQKPSKPQDKKKKKKYKDEDDDDYVFYEKEKRPKKTNKKTNNKAKTEKKPVLERKSPRVKKENLTKTKTTISPLNTNKNIAPIQHKIINTIGNENINGIMKSTIHFDQTLNLSSFPIEKSREMLYEIELKKRELEIERKSTKIQNLKRKKLNLKDENRKLREENDRLKSFNWNNNSLPPKNNILPQQYNQLNNNNNNLMHHRINNNLNQMNNPNNNNNNLNNNLNNNNNNNNNLNNNINNNNNNNNFHQIYNHNNNNRIQNNPINDFRQPYLAFNNANNNNNPNSNGFETPVPIQGLSVEDLQYESNNNVIQQDFGDYDVKNDKD
eukprot:TRINITY_DN5639_c0_g2_i1.p1 TRINITY_DN5639_c0_g2~~TRINITY_DN5639_c0_g2_i1.p1  ORF type:complete len:588 (+),score=197.12 TRINITY_DN5639_c0_g2_i1:3-1766(+)